MNINCIGITKSYSDTKTSDRNNVLKEVNLKISEGEAVALTGPSGSGKTTLLNIISGLDDPSSGNVFFSQKITFRLTFRFLKI